MKCTYCNGKVDETYKVNQLGAVFCNEDCYDEFMDENESAPDDWNHPYIDDYELMRSNYIDWLENWQSDLHSVSGKQIILKPSDMLDTIDEVFEEYWDYYRTEGDDGIFAREIYLYLLKFDQLQKEITEWQPATQLGEDGRYICMVCQRGVEGEEDCKSLLFCHGCEQSYCPGTFSKGELKKRIDHFNTYKNLKSRSKTKEWPYLLRKIKRSCRYYDMDFPEWIELNYEF